MFKTSVIVPEQNYSESQAVLDPRGDLLLKWRVDFLARKITFQLVISEEASPFNWLAVGFSDRGELADADVCLIWTDYEGRYHFEVRTFFF